MLPGSRGVKSLNTAVSVLADIDPQISNNVMIHCFKYIFLHNIQTLTVYKHLKYFKENDRD